MEEVEHQLAHTKELLNPLPHLSCTPTTKLKHYLPFDPHKHYNVLLSAVNQHLKNIGYHSCSPIFHLVIEDSIVADEFAMNIVPEEYLLKRTDYTSGGRRIIMVEVKTSADRV
jgi:hypothetical protein